VPQTVRTATASALRAGRATPWWRWTILGTVGATAMVAASGTISTLPVPASAYWWRGLTTLNYATQHLFFYVGFALLALSWWMIEPVRSTSLRPLIVSGACWATPLFIGAPLFSRDIYSYVAVGQILHLGLNPYVITPAMALHGTALTSVANVWRNTITPYGPVFLLVQHLVVIVGGPNESVSILVTRAAELLGVGGLLFSLRWAPLSTTQRAYATWLAVASPSALVCYVASSHNDTLMIGLLLLGLAAITRQRYFVTGLAFGLAVATKTPAALAVVFAALALRPRASDIATPRRWRPSLTVPVVAGLTVALTTVAAGDGWGWLSPTALRLPTKLHTEITPVNNVAHLLYLPFRLVGHGPNFHLFLHVVTLAGEAVAAIVLVRLALGVNVRNLRLRTGLGLLTLALLSPTMWPWYVMWGLVVLATTPAARRRSLQALAGVSTLLVGAGGTMMIGGNGWIVTSPLLVAALVWFVATGRWRTCLALEDAN